MISIDEGQMARKGIEVVPGRPRHAALILPCLRREELGEIAAIVLRPRRAVLHMIRCSLYCRALFLDGEIAALGGLVASLMGAEARAWLLTTAAVERRPLAFLRFMQTQIDCALAHYRSVSACGPEDAERVLRFWRLLGARIGEPQALGRHGERLCAIVWEAA